MSDPMQLSHDIEKAKAEAEEALAKAQALVDEQEALLALETKWYEPGEEIPDLPGWYEIFCPIIPGAIGLVRPPELIEVNGDGDIVNANMTSYIRSQFGARMTVREIIDASAKASSYAYAELVSEAIAKRVETVSGEDRTS
jgi:hypothetical protein